MYMESRPRTLLTANSRSPKQPYNYFPFPSTYTLEKRHIPRHLEWESKSRTREERLMTSFPLKTSLYSLLDNLKSIWGLIYDRPAAGAAHTAVVGCTRAPFKAHRSAGAVDSAGWPWYNRYKARYRRRVAAAAVASGRRFFRREGGGKSWECVCVSRGRELRVDERSACVQVPYRARGQFCGLVLGRCVHVCEW